MVTIAYWLCLAFAVLLTGCASGRGSEAPIAETRSPSSAMSPAPPSVPQSPSSCAEAPLPSDSTTAIQTDRRCYEVEGEEITLVVRYTNRTSDTVYIAPRGEARWNVDRWVNGEWQEAIPFASIRDFGTPTAVPSGATHTETLEIPLGIIGHHLPRGQPVTGTYRFRYKIHQWWRVVPSPEPNMVGRVQRGPRLPEEQRVSHPFVIIDKRPGVAPMVRQ